MSNKITYFLPRELSAETIILLNKLGVAKQDIEDGQFTVETNDVSERNPICNLMKAAGTNGSFINELSHYIVAHDGDPSNFSAKDKKFFDKMVSKKFNPTLFKWDKSPATMPVPTAVQNASLSTIYVVFDPNSNDIPKRVGTFTYLERYTTESGKKYGAFVTSSHFFYDNRTGTFTTGSAFNNGNFPNPHVFKIVAHKPVTEKMYIVMIDMSALREINVQPISIAAPKKTQKQLFAINANKAIKPANNPHYSHTLDPSSTHTGKTSNDRFIIFDATSTHGDSGSPVVNETGELVGIVEAGNDKYTAASIDMQPLMDTLSSFIEEHRKTIPSE